MSTFQNTSTDLFRKEAATFFRATQDRSGISPEQADSGFKALSLLYLGHDDDWTERDIHSAVLTLELASKRCFEVSLANTQELEDEEGLTP